MITLKHLVQFIEQKKKNVFKKSWGLQQPPFRGQGFNKD